MGKEHEEFRRGLVEVGAKAKQPHACYFGSEGPRTSVFCMPLSYPSREP